MRPIKFRIWHDGLMYMVYEMTFNANSLHEVHAQNDEAWSCYHSSDTNKYVLMQFTGLLDKNGKEIYEGDIVYAADYWGESGSVYWNERQLQWWVKRFSGAEEPLRSPFTDDMVVFEVIGNIYEHPRLSGVMPHD
jgi:uncharacterized phage protein (TIGR01671 family)